MKIYFGKNKKSAKVITFQDLLIKKLKEAGLEMDNGCFCDENHSWVGIVQKSSAPSEVLVNISFNIEEDTIDEVNVFETPIITIVDEDNLRKLV